MRFADRRCSGSIKWTPVARESFLAFEDEMTFTLRVMTTDPQMKSDVRISVDVAPDLLHSDRLQQNRLGRIRWPPLCCRPPHNGSAPGTIRRPVASETRPRCNRRRSSRRSCRPSTTSTRIAPLNRT